MGLTDSDRLFVLDSDVVRYLREFVEREQALHDQRSKGGQHVGYSPSVSPSVLKNLKRILNGEPGR